jgi:hypothetical protein
MTLRRPIGCATVLFLLILGGLLVGVPGGSVRPAGGPPAALVVSDSCPGAGVPATPNGGLGVDGGDLNPRAVVGVTVSYRVHLAVRLVNLTDSAVAYRGCLRYTANTTTNASGAFDFPSVVPTVNCTEVPGYCAFFSGPFGPATISVPQVPPGYAVEVAGGPSNYSLTFVDELTSLHLSPGSSTITLSPRAPTTFAVRAYMANGTPSPLDPTFSWTLNGSGWSYIAPPVGAEASVIADPGAGVGTLAVTADAAVDGVTIVPRGATATLLEQPTAIETADLDRTTLDAGATLTARFEGVGAAGYNYTATVEPGLGLPAVAAACAVRAATGGDANMTCIANLTYPLPGIAQPTARLTNGYSASSWQFPDVSIDAAPELTVAPGYPTGYVGSVVPIEVSVANRTGAAPFSTACLAVATQAVDCRSSPGPTWEFGATFSAPGTYPAVAWAIDAQGRNASTSFQVAVVEPLSVGPVEPTAENGSVGTAEFLSSTIAGGELPARYWWNASGVDGSIGAGSATADGPISATFVPAAPGGVTVSLTVIDALGTIVEVERLLSVGPEPALTIVAIDPPPATAVGAGAPFGLAWEAFDRSDAPVRSFGVGASIDLSEGGRPVRGSVNASGIGPLASLGDGDFDLPPDGWHAGVLDLSITVTEAGTLTVALVGDALPAPVAALTVDIAPDRAHLRLSEPRVEIAGSRSNSTFWQVTDRYGNAAPGALLTVRLRWQASSRTTLVAAVAATNGSTGVWVNFSAPTAGGANVTVLDAAGAVLLGPLPIPALPAPPVLAAATVSLGAAVPIGALGAAWSGIVARRARHRARAQVGEADLHRLAEGRSQAVELVRRAGAADLSELEAAWQPAPAPGELADWLASLVADGTLGAAVGEDGRARFCLASGRPTGPRVTIDAAVFDRALRRRDEMLDVDEAEP